MNHTHDEMIAIIQDNKDGKMTQWKQYIDDEWMDKPHPVYQFASGFYRTKPEKKVGYVNIYIFDDITRYAISSDRDSADKKAGGAEDKRAARVRIEYYEGQFDE